MEKVEKTVNNDAVYFTLSGKLNSGAAENLLTHLGQTQERDQFIFDMTKAEYMTSCFLGVLISVRKNCDQRGKPMPIVLNASRVMDIFKLSGAEKLFKFQEA